MAEPTIAETAEQYREAGKEAVAGALEAVSQSEPAKFLAGLIADVLSVLLRTSFTALAPIGEGFARGLADAEDQLAPLLARFATEAVNDIFGTQLSEAEF